MITADDMQYIDTPEALADFAGRLRGAPWIALDTEFLRETTYYPKLCLLQVGTPELLACVDPLALPDLEPLLEVIYDPAVTKVMHAGRQDLEIFWQLRGTPPAPLFDTQVAAPLLGFPEQAGYATLVAEILGVKLAKTHTRTDWSQRPLSEAQLRYAADDVVYLCQLYLRLREELEQRGRLAWLEDEFAQLADPALYANPPPLAWRRVKAAYKMRGRQLAVLQALAEWRERTAQAENRPRGRLMKDDTLADLARMMPSSPAELGQLRGLHERTVGRHGRALLELIKTAREHTPEPLPEYERAAKPSDDEEALVDLLNAVVHLRAVEHQLNPAQLAPHKALQRLVGGDHEVEIMHGWRRRLVGDELLAILRGERLLQVRDGRLQVLAAD